MANQSIPTNVRDAIAAVNENIMTAFKKGDAAGLAAFYTENGQILAPNSDFVTGRHAIQEFWQAVLGMGIKEIRLESVEVESQGDTAIEVGINSAYGGEGQEIDKGKYIVIWKREHGQWKLHRDIANSSNPVPG
jgi:uncharacterized protein (TIGR02246 family)